MMINGTYTFNSTTTTTDLQTLVIWVIQSGVQ